MRVTIARMVKPREDKDAQIEHILTQLEEKRSLSEICRDDPGVPRMSLFLGWVKKDPSLAERYACAREAQITSALEEIITIADDATDDATVLQNPHTKRWYAKLDGASVRRSQLMIEARERFAKMMMPERFAQQRMDVTSGGKALPSPVQHNDNRIVALLTLAAERAAGLAAVGNVSSKMIDVTPLGLEDVMDC